MPAVFRAVRAVSNIDEADYMLSLAGNYYYILTTVYNNRECMCVYFCGFALSEHKNVHFLCDIHNLVRTFIRKLTLNTHSLIYIVEDIDILLLYNNYVFRRF